MRVKEGSTKKAKQIALKWIDSNLKGYKTKIKLGLPEYDDRLKNWRIPLFPIQDKTLLIGEIKVDYNLKGIVETTELKLVRSRIDKNNNSRSTQKLKSPSKSKFYPAPISNKVILGDSAKVLEDFPPDTAQLVFTSPPYYNAKPEYSEYVDYVEYLDFIKKIFKRCHSVLSEGRFMVVNISPVLIRRTSRKTSSRRVPIPFDYHRLLVEVGFEFIDDIIWQKPEGAGWNVGRGRRFKADRKPLQYKPVPVTEYVLVYRKKTDKLIDWNLRKHHNLDLIEESKILGEYDVTNIWKIHPGHSKIHPAIFPEALAEKVIRYYSFKDDLVLDPFGGTGTTAISALNLNRRFLMVENEQKYYNYMKERLIKANEENLRIDFDIHEEFNNHVE